MDGHELVAWSALTCLLVVIALVQFEFARRAVGLLGEWLLRAVTSEPEADQDALDLYRALRRQRLLEHLARLRRILADDEHQSAVRQIGNRLAYGQLLAELAELREVVLVPDTNTGWTTPAPVAAVAGRGASGGQYASRVEILDFGRRS